MAYSRDGKTIATGSNDGTGRLWDAATGTPIGRPLRHQAQVTSVAFSPDGKTVVTGSNDTHGPALGRRRRSAHRARGSPMTGRSSPRRSAPTARWS